MEIKETTTYSFELIKKFSIFHLLYRLKWVIPFFVILEIILLIPFISLLLFSNIHENLFSLIISTFSILIFTITFLILPNIQSRLSKNLFGTENNFTFNEEGVTIISNSPNINGKSEIKYNQFEKIYEAKDCLYIYLTKLMAYPLPKRNIQENKCEDLIRLLKSKLPAKKYLFRQSYVRPLNMNMNKYKNFKMVIFILLMFLSINPNVYCNNLQEQEKFKTFSTVSMIIEEKTKVSHKVLLQLRQNTGWMDNHWDLASCGHVEKNETLKQAAIRESKEELNIDIYKDDLEMVGIQHNFIESKGIYYCFYFKVNNFRGDIKIGEPEKCSELKWFDVNDLPDNIIPIRKIALENYLNNIIYSELQWENLN